MLQAPMVLTVLPAPLAPKDLRVPTDLMAFPELMEPRVPTEMASQAEAITRLPA